MRTALLCERWELPFDVELKTESDRNLRDRSYLHYVAEHMPMVAAKCWATKWLLEDILDTSKEYSVREYMAGVGVQSVLIQNLFKVRQHIVSEIDNECAEHLMKLPFDLQVLIDDAKQSLLLEDNSDLKFLDFPSSSIVQIMNNWKDGFYNLFTSKPDLVVWTDTSVTYPISLHREKYSQILGGPPMLTKDDYVDCYSNWLFRNFGYSIIKAAYRGRNAVYFAAVKGMHKTEFKHFSIDENKNGFYFLEGTLHDYT